MAHQRKLRLADVMKVFVIRPSFVAVIFVLKKTYARSEIEVAPCQSVANDAGC